MSGGPQQGQAGQQFSARSQMQPPQGGYAQSGLSRVATMGSYQPQAYQPNPYRPQVFKPQALGPAQPFTTTQGNATGGLLTDTGSGGVGSVGTSGGSATGQNADGSPNGAPSVGSVGQLGNLGLALGMSGIPGLIGAAISMGQAADAPNTTPATDDGTTQGIADTIGALGLSADDGAGGVGGIGDSGVGAAAAGAAAGAGVGGGVGAGGGGGGGK